MEKHIQHIELINQYINGLLSKSDSLDFENKLKTDATFNVTYHDHLLFLEGLKRNQLKTEIQSAQKSYTQTKWIKAIGISCGVVILTVLLFSIFFNADANQAIQPSDDNSSIEIVSDSIVNDALIKSETRVEDEVIKITDTIKKAKQKTPNSTVSKIANDSKEVINSIEIPDDSTKIIQPDVLSPELIAFYKSVKKAPETFEINNERAITITCKEGTKLTIPAKAFIDIKTGKSIRGLVTFEVTEYYKLSDMLLANLSTKSDDELLETGGMLYIDANKKGSKLKLKPDKQIQVTFNDKGKKDMQLFSGESNNNEINWKLERHLGSTLKTKPIIDVISFEDENIQVPINIVEEPPTFPGCENGTKIQKRKCLEENLQSLIEQNFNKSIAEDLNLIGNHRISVSFKIDKEGEVIDIQARAAHVKLGQEAIRVVELIPKMQPATQRGKTVFVPYGLPIYLSVGESTKNNPALITVKGKRKFKTQFENTIETRLSGRDSILSNGEVPNTITTNEISRYAFSVSQLGWINCDRFVKIKNKLKFKIKIKDADGANVKMVFKSLSSILPSEKRQDEFDFGTIPANEQVTIVAIKEKDGAFYLAIKDLETKLNPKVDFEFKSVTIEELKSKLRKLNEWFN